MNTKFGGHYPTVARNTRRDHLMFVAAAGLALSLLIILLVVSNKSSEPTPEVSQDSVMTSSVSVGTVTLLASDKALRPGEKIPEGSIKEIYWPRNEVPDGAVLDISELRNKFAKVNISAAVPIQRAQLSDEKIVDNLPITPGMRAVTLEVDAETGLEGWALPGTKVDLALTHMVDGNLTTQIIVQNARVLSASGNAETANDRPALSRKRVSPSTTVTLEVSPADALKVQTAKKLGSLSLIGRDSSDDKATPTTSVNAPSIMGGPTTAGTSVKRSCNRGSMRIEGRQYIIDCDGSITPVHNEDT
jgi:Flp pilus assembly protein CpaB